MFKDYNKYLRESLKVYTFVLAIIVILKLIGFDYFGLDVNNNIMLQINTIFTKYKIVYVWYFINLYIQFYLYLGLVCNERKHYVVSLIATMLNITSQLIIFNIFKEPNLIYYFINFGIMFAFPYIVNKKVKPIKIVGILLLMTFYQMLSIIIRNVNIKYSEWNFIIDTILNIDQLLLLIITYNINFMNGGIEICGQEVGLSSQKKTNLKRLHQKSHTNWQNKSKEDKISLIIYVILSLIWNILNLAIILLVAKLNNTLIECIFILTSFWLSKRSFGKAFHLSSMTHCFVVSNLTYYLLNRITTPIGISIVVPVLLGVGLSYITSKFVKKIYKPLYRGMPVDLFNETILRVSDKESHKYNICYEYYIEMKSAISLSMKYHYSEDGIRQICKRINEKIKRLE